MRKTNNNRVPRRRARRNRGYQTYQDTVRLELKTGTGNTAYTASIASLLPGLAEDAATDRLVVIERIILQMMPNNYRDQVMVQLQCPADLVGSVATGAASETFKLASSINPTTFELNLRKLARIMPAVLTPIPISTSVSGLRMVFYSNEDATVEVVGRITTYVRVLPQKSLLGTIGFLEPLSPATSSVVDPPDRVFPDPAASRIPLFLKEKKYEAYDESPHHHINVS